jgi:hypothetical protein
MLDPISLSVSLASLVVPKLCDGLLEKMGADLGQKGIRKSHEMIAAFKNRLCDRFQDDRHLLQVLDAEESSAAEIEVFQSALTQKLTTQPEFLQEIRQIQQEWITAVPQLTLLFEAPTSGHQRIAEGSHIAGSLDIEEVIQEGKGSGSQEVFNGSTIAPTGSVKIGKIHHRG